MSTVSVIGLGYIGLPTALMLASHGVQVIGTDYDSARIRMLQEKGISFTETGLSELFSNALETKKIHFTEEYCPSDIYIVSVPTPYNADTKQIDASMVCAAVEEIITVCNRDAIIIIESTIPPGAIDRFVRPIIQKSGLTIGRDIHLAHAPERIVPGRVIFELEHNARTIGADEIQVGEKVRDLYASFCQGEIVVTDIRTAEMSKVVENAFRDVNIAFANELLKICRSADLDVYETIRIANKHPRVNILQPGPGVGGHCIPVDPWFLVGDYPTLTDLIRTARGVNDSMPDYVLERVSRIMRDREISTVTSVGIYGLTYKENVDDIRDSPTLQMLDSMERHLGSGVIVYDPNIRYDVVPNQVHDFEEFIQRSELIVLMVAHDEIKMNISKLSGKVVLDTRNAIQQSAISGIEVFKL